MIKPSYVLIVAAACLAACDGPTKAKTWQYEFKEDHLRDLTTTVASLESNENWGNQPDRAQMVMTITSGSADANANGITLTSESYTCTQPINLRVDDHSIQQVPGSEGAYCLKLAPDSELAQRIMSSEEVVVELDGAGGPQLTFATDGLDLP